MKKTLLFLLLLASLIFPQHNFKFAWLTDTHIGVLDADEDLVRAVNDINSQNDVAFTIISGDISNVGSYRELQLAKNILDKLNKPYYIIPGNHDTKWSESGCTDFTKIFGKDRFVFDYDKFLFVGLHEGPRMKMTDGYFAPEDLRWFDSTIVKPQNKNKPIIFITHYPLDESIGNWFEMTERLHKINTLVVLFGHGHINKVYNFDSIPGIMSRSNLRAKNDVGDYTIAEVKNDSMFFVERNPVTKSENMWYSLSFKQNNFNSSNQVNNKPDYSINYKFPNVKTLWTFNSGYTIGSSAVNNDSSVFFGDVSGMFYSLNINSGKVKWKFKTQNVIYSTPYLINDKIIFGSADSSVYCLTSVDGKLDWSYKTNAAVLGCPIVKDDKVFIGGSDHKFYALDLENGVPVWTFSGLNGFVETKPALYENKILFGAWDENFYCLNENTGKLFWKWEDVRLGMFYSPAACWPVVSKGIVFFAAPDRKLTALDINSGRELWRTGIYQVRETVGLSEGGNELFIRTMNDTILALPVSNILEKPLWITNCGFGYEISSAQIVEKDGTIFYPTKNGMIYALDSKTGKIIWQYKITNGFINTITAVSKNRIITTDFDGNVMLITSHTY
jgi:outer membrane protein assembly factor BamB/predicted phosphodiesterase